MALPEPRALPGTHPMHLEKALEHVDRAMGVLAVSTHPRPIEVARAIGTAVEALLDAAGDVAVACRDDGHTQKDTALALNVPARMLSGWGKPGDD